MRATLGLILFFCIVALLCDASSNSLWKKHELCSELIKEIEHCANNVSYCDNHSIRLASISAKIANEHSSIMLPSVAQALLTEVVARLPFNSSLHSSVSHILAALAFSQGDGPEVHWY